LAKIGLNLLILLAKVSKNVKLLRLRALTTMTIKRRQGSQERKDVFACSYFSDRAHNIYTDIRYHIYQLSS